MATDEALEHLGRGRGWRPAAPSVSVEPALEQRGDDRNLVLHALQREEHAVDGLFELGVRLVEVGGVVVAQSARVSLARNDSGRPCDVGVERVQERVEVLARAVDALVGVLLVHRRTVAGELADVGERVQQTPVRR